MASHIAANNIVSIAAVAKGKLGSGVAKKDKGKDQGDQSNALIVVDLIVSLTAPNESP